MVVQPGEEAVECGQRLVIERVAVGEFGQERHVWGFLTNDYYDVMLHGLLVGYATRSFNL